MDPVISVFTVLILLMAFVLVTLGAQVMRRQKRIRLALRRIDAYRMMPLLISEAVESERPIHVSFGSSGIGADSTVSALAVADLLYPLVERGAIASQTPIVSLSDPTALGLAQGTLMRAYRRRNTMEFYTSAAARWYPQGSRSLAFAAGVSASIAEEDSNMSVVAGGFGPEIAFIGEQTMRYDQTFLGQSDQLDGQAIAWVMTQQPLIGEELYVAGAYLPQEPAPLHLSQLLAMEGLRLAVIVAILFIAVISFAVEWINWILLGIGITVIVLVVAFLIDTVRQRRRGQAS
ncbi:DUF6754 domain-containing protein [Chloroflexota bacterium]